MANARTFAIVGAGQAGAWVAKTLRAEGCDARIVLIGSEAHAPYERPPLSKGILSGESDPAVAMLLGAAEMAALDIEHWPATDVTAIDRDKREIATTRGTLGYDRLFLTTGARPRTIEVPAAAASSDRIHVLRTLDDAARLRGAIAAKGRLAVIGGGWIGLEVAATARMQGLDVTVIEAGERLCARSVPPAISDFLARLHRHHGVTVNTGCPVGAVEVSDRHVAIITDDGTSHFDHAVIGIGVTPETGLAEAAGLEVDNGIVVDMAGRTRDPAIFAAGDATSQPGKSSARRVRLESWANAQNQAIVAAKAALGQDAIHDEVPWLWSDQFGRNIQIVGSFERAATMHLRGNPDENGGCWLALDKAGHAVGAVAVDAPRDLRVVRKALQAGTTPDPAQWSRDDLPVGKVALTVVVPDR